MTFLWPLAPQVAVRSGVTWMLPVQSDKGSKHGELEVSLGFESDGAYAAGGQGKQQQEAGYPGEMCGDSTKQRAE